MPTDAPVTHVSDTARWVAMYRAMESDRPDAVFRDPFARRLAGPRGEEILRGMRKGRQFAWPMIVRTAVMDEIIERSVNQDGFDAVLNLGSGLDTRPYRLDLPGALPWIDADFPDMVAYKRAELAGARPRCALEYAPVDATNGDERLALFGRAAAAGSKVLVVTEGLLVYLRAEQVAELARDLHGHGTLRGWLIDLVAPKLLQRLQRTWGSQLARGNAPLVFGPAEGTEFFRPCGWEEAEFRSTFHEATRLNRAMRFAWFWRLLVRTASRAKQEELRRMSGIVMLRRA